VDEMPAKRLLYLSAPNAAFAKIVEFALPSWEIYHASNIKQANRELANRHYLIGLIENDSHQISKNSLEFFLESHSDIVWVGIFNREELKDNEYTKTIIRCLFDFHTAPVDPQRLVFTLGHCYGCAFLRHKQGKADEPNVSQLIGDSKAMASLRSQIKRTAKSNAPIVLFGESGTGKELAAAMIHSCSPRSNGSFVPVNCGAIAPSLIHSELFGYERGAFTGATRGKIGLIESANGGTLFLDEIGDLPKELQSNLLRFLQENTISRVGSTTTIRVDVRVIAASHIDLHEAALNGDFRSDLYYRLSVISLSLPPLRERREDLMTLANHYFLNYSNEKNCYLEGFSDCSIASIMNYDWPGNVRELVNRIRRALVFAEGPLIEPRDLGLEDCEKPRASDTIDQSMKDAEYETLFKCLTHNRYNVSRAAQHLGISRTTIYRLMDKYQICPSSARALNMFNSLK
jgi:DNA-binding NtrC family response regulator